MCFPTLDISRETSFGKGAVVSVLLMVFWISSERCRAAPCLSSASPPAQPCSLPPSCSSSTKIGKFKKRQTSLESEMLFQGLKEPETWEILSLKDTLCKRRGCLRLVNWTENLLLLSQAWSEVTEKFKSYPLIH